MRSNVGATGSQRAIGTMMPNEHMLTLDLDGKHHREFPNIIYAVSGKRNLRELRVKLGDESATALPQAVGKLTKLESILLQENEWMTSVHDSVWDLPSLASFVAWKCGLEAIGDNLGNATTLRTLALSENSLTSLPDSLGKLRRVDDFQAAQNKIAALPATIGDMRALERLDVGHNALRDLPAGFCKLTKLQFASLNHNQLTRLPLNIGNMHALREVDVSHNELVDLPPSLGQLVLLRTLNVSHNKLRMLPDDIGRCVELMELNVEHNKLVELPPCVVYMTKLDTLHLRGNPLNHHRTDKYGMEFTYEAVIDQIAEKERKRHLEDFDAILGLDGTGKLLPMPRNVYTISQALADGVPKDVAFGYVPGIQRRVLNAPTPSERAYATGEFNPDVLLGGDSSARELALKQERLEKAIRKAEESVSGGAV